jgi:putative membrane protein
VVNWWLEAELNRRHKDFQSSALPTELSSHPGEERLLIGAKKRFARDFLRPCARENADGWLRLNEVLSGGHMRRGRLSRERRCSMFRSSRARVVMPEMLKAFFQRWIVSTVAVLVATYVVPGIKYGNWRDLLIATLVLGLLNSFLRPVLMLLSLPLLIVTLGLFTIIINALLLLLVSWLLGDQHFHVSGFWSAFWGALVISIISLLLNSITGTGDARVSVHRGKPPVKKDDDKDGPVIDV